MEDQRFGGAYSYDDFAAMVLKKLQQGASESLQKGILKVWQSQEVRKQMEGEFSKLFDEDWIPDFSHLTTERAFEATVSSCAMNIELFYSFCEEEMHL